MQDIKVTVKNLVIKNFGYKLVSLLAAMALWSGFVGRGEFILAIDLGVNFLLPSGVALQAPTEIIRVKLKGPEMAMKKYSRHTKTVTVDLINYSAGFHQVKVTRRQLDLPPGIQVIDIKPEFLDVNLVKPEGQSHGN